jgi:DNA-directed RNA polymerase subunit RPC12/RpoP
MVGTPKSDSKTDAQRTFEELLRKTEAYLKEEASLESEGGKQEGVSKKNGKDWTTKSVPSNLLSIRALTGHPEQGIFPMNETTSSAQATRCPYCGSKQFYRSRRNGLKDWLLFHVLFQNPYRCAACDGRFFHTSLGHHHREHQHHHA